jgi:hypothetical protein
LPGALIAVLVVIPWTAASAAVLTVGDHGSYPTIAGAVNAAYGTGDNEIRVEQGTYFENFWIGSGLGSDTLEITGGWNATFSIRSTDASLTVIDGSQQANPAVGIFTDGGSLTIEGFTVTNGTSSSGGGFAIRPSGDAEVIIRNNRIIGNTASADSIPGGGGVYFRQFTGNGTVFLTGNLISGNTVVNTGSTSASGGGVFLYAHDASSFVATGNRITNNFCVAPLETAFGCGANLYHDSSATSGFSDNLIKGNRTTTAAGTDVQGAGGSLAMGQNGNALNLTRNIWIDNRDVASQEGFHIKYSTRQTGTLTASDTVVAGGADVGVGAWSYDSSTLRLTNHTVFDHSDTGVLFRGFGAESTLYNAIIFGSATATDFSGTNVSTGGNLVGVDPLFADPASWDCRLGHGSPALDSGNNAPPGGLGPTDADGNPRVVNGVVDAGAFERGPAIFANSFEVGYPWAWSTVVP